MNKEKELLSLKIENKKLKENLNQLNRELVQQLARIKKLEEEIERLKDENQKLRLELFGIKPSMKKEDKSSDERSVNNGIKFPKFSGLNFPTSL